MKFHLLRGREDADRPALRLAMVLCLAAAAVLALSAFLYAEITSVGQHGSATAPPRAAVAPFVLLPTVPQASDVFPAASSPEEPTIAAYGG